ncbi:MAG: FRG domain-containing protein [Phycisphaerales bacterium]|nr:FRG domain-containing protein [Phycisphaerales bacterium]
MAITIRGNMEALQPLSPIRWTEYKQRLVKYSEMEYPRRRQLIFRGQSDSRYELKTTLDRMLENLPAGSNSDRDSYENQLRVEFMSQSRGLEDYPDQNELPAILALARHHGLPSPLLDWTESPYVAAYFAFDPDVAHDTKAISIWILDRNVYAERNSPSDVLEFLDSDDVLRLNNRAIEQRGLFLWVKKLDQPLQVKLRSMVSRIDIDIQDRDIALADLDAMMINARTMFRTLEGAARLATRRILK